MTEETKDLNTPTPSDATAAPLPEQEAASSSSTEPNSVKNDEESKTNGEGEQKSEAPKVLLELHQLVDLSTKYPDIGPVVAKLAERLGFPKIADRVVRLGLETDDTPMEFYYVATKLARDEQRPKDALDTVLKALDRTVSSWFKTSEPPSKADRSRLLHIVRLGFQTLMFDFEDIRSQPEVTEKLTSLLKELEPLYDRDSFFLQLLAQALWFSDEKASEEEWEKAVSCGEPEDVWNARGTWYKEASNDQAAAESAYRRGLEKTTDSALIMHNLAQVLMDRAEECFRVDPALASTLVNEAEGHLRRAKRVAHRHIMRSHVFETFDRLRKLKSKIDNSTSNPEVGDVLTGRVTSVKPYGAFIVLPSGHTGLLHSSEIDHCWVEDATTRYKEGEPVEVKVIKVEKRKGNNGAVDLRVSLSRKVLVEKPADFDESLARPPHRRKGRDDDSRRPQNRNNDRRNDSARRFNNNNNNQSRGRQNHNNNNRNRNSTQAYRDSGTGATIADILSAKLNLSSKEDN